MERDWARLGRALAQARRDRGLSQVEVADGIGVTRTPIQAVERGKEFKKITGTMRSYARIVGWTEGSIERVLAGGEPELAAEDDEGSARPSGLPLRVTRELDSSGEVLDATVIDVGPTAASSHMVIVIKGKPDASPEQIARDLERWAKAEEELRRQFGHDNDGGDSPLPPAHEA